VRQQRRRILLETIGKKQRYTVWRQDLDDLMDHALCHGESAVTDLDGQEQLGDWIERRLHPMG
jgi:hypothetical protein